MAADAPGLKGIFVPLDPDDLAMLELAADKQEPAEFLRQSALAVARGIVGNLDPDAAAEGVEDDAEEPERDAEPMLPIAAVDPDTAALLERVTRVEDLLREVVAIETTILSELYAHTAFRDAGHEKECRTRAEAKIAKIAPAIMRLLTGGRPASTVN